MDGYIASKIRAAERIIEGLADIDELTPQAVRPGDRHTYWILGFSLDTERLGCSADVFADAVRHEGVLLIKAENSVDARHPSTGLPRMGGGGPLYNDPFLAGPDCYGRGRFPFDHGRERAVALRAGRVSERGGADGSHGWVQHVAESERCGYRRHRGGVAESG